MSDNNFIKEIGRSYLVSAFLPSALFVSLAATLFNNFIPRLLTLKSDANDMLSRNGWALLLIFTLWVAFFLFSSVDWVVKLFEGYYMPRFLSSQMIKSKLERHKENSRIYKKIEQLRKKDESELTIQEYNRFNRLLPKAIAELQNLEMHFPIDSDILMPTRLGNVLRASEVYADERYSMVGVTIWPRLFPVLPRQFILDMQEKYNQLMFLLNSSLLAYTVGTLSFVLGFVGFGLQVTTWIQIPLELRSGISVLMRNYAFIQPAEYMLIALLFVLFGYVMYNTSVNTARDYTLFIRAGFDLYRKDLIQQLDFEIPKNLVKEKELWQLLSEYFIAGERLARQPFIFPDYKTRENSPSKKE